MLVDSHPSSAASNFSFPSSFEDFFNMDLVSSSQSNSGSSASSPHSPPHSSFPLTPPQQPAMQSFGGGPYDMGMGMNMMGGTSSGDPSEFLSMYLDEDYASKPMMPVLSSPPTTAGAYDFLGAFNALASSSTAGSASSGSPHTMTTDASPPQFSIDPALVGTPSTGKAPSEFEGEHEHEDNEDEEDDEDGDDNDNEHESPIAPSATSASTAPAPVKVGGKGKGRKGTVVSGGINKKSSVTTSPNATGKENLKGGGDWATTSKEEDKDSDDWRPSPEEYKKMSSKEKRQLRNKISARNFRVRRKEYISTLEADISSRDNLISAIRSELGSSKSENVALRQEIAALKKSLLSGRGIGEAPVLPPPGPLSPPVSATSRGQSPLMTPNTQKDLPTSPRVGARGFWGGATPGGFTPVHTTFVPPLSMVGLARKGVQENINPALNAPPPQPTRAYSPPPPIHSPSPFASPALNANVNNGSGKGVPTPGFDAFADMNPFTLKTLDAYRMQLWGKMAAQNHAYQLQQQQQSHYLQQQQQQQQQGQQLSGLANALRPAFFRDANVGPQGLSGILAGKASSSSSSAAASYPTPPSSPPTKSAVPAFAITQKERERDAMFAAIASQTLIGKLGSAFWGAFSGGDGAISPSAGGSGSSKQWDADKVRRVLEGKAVVRVVDVESPTTSPKVSAPKVAEVKPTSPKMECTHAAAMQAMGDILEESMRSLTLGKK